MGRIYYAFNPLMHGIFFLQFIYEDEKVSLGGNELKLFFLFVFLKDHFCNYF